MRYCGRETKEGWQRSCCVGQNPLADAAASFQMISLQADSRDYRSGRLRPRPLHLGGTATARSAGSVYNSNRAYSCVAVK